MSDVPRGVVDSSPQNDALADVFPLEVQAAKTGDVETLVKCGADLSAIDPKYRATPLGWAEHFEQQEIVALLNSLGAQ